MASPRRDERRGGATGVTGGPSYGPLNGMARNRINTQLITGNWDEICRLTASLRAGTVIPSAILRTLGCR